MSGLYGGYASGMNCPTCSEALVHHLHEGAELDACPSGHGVWLDPGELRDIVDSRQAPRSSDEKAAARAAGTARPEPDSRAAHACPACDTPMERFVYDEASGVTIENCLDHGVWLDEGELQRIEAWIEAASDNLDVPSSFPEEDARLAASNKLWEQVDRDRSRLGPFENVAEGFLFWQARRRKLG